MNPDTNKILDLLNQWLTSRLDANALAWVRERQTAIQSGDKKALFLAFGLTPRKVGKLNLALSTDEMIDAETARPGWNLQDWSIEQAVRTLFVLSFPSHDVSTFVAILDQLFSTGEVGELVALYQALPLLPHQTAHVLRAAEGIRTNMLAVFCAVAHRNPFPSEQFSDDQWNQMVLKCQFINAPMSPIVGLDKRANASLARMVTDFIHERWAAKRPVPPEMWRCVGRFADARALDDLKTVLTTGSPADQGAAALALSECPSPTAKEILATVPELAKQVADGKIHWDTVSDKLSAAGFECFVEQ